MIPTLHCVDDGVPAETLRFLGDACASRRIEMKVWDAPTFDHRPERRLEPGALLYRPAVSVAAARVEQFLFSEGVATFHRSGDGVYAGHQLPQLVFARAGLPIPDMVSCCTRDRKVIRGYVDLLGGFPLVLKVLGRSGGIGVMRVDSFPTLFSLVDYVVGHCPLLMRFIPGATHFRFIVVGDGVVASYRNSDEKDDFRTFAGTNPDDYRLPIDPALSELAVAAVRSLHIELGGVDIVRDRDGRPYVLEANFPCYFGHAQEIGGVDVAGAMVDHLKAKSERGGTGRG